MRGFIRFYLVIYQQIKATLSNIKWGRGIKAGQTALGGDAASYAEKLGGFGNNSSELKEQADYWCKLEHQHRAQLPVTDPMQRM